MTHSLSSIDIPGIGTAFPVHDVGLMGENKILSLGLTKREYIAALVLQGLMSKDIPFSALKGEMNAGETFAKWSVDFADALIKELNKETK